MIAHELAVKLAAALKAVLPYANTNNDFTSSDYQKHNAALSEARAALAEYNKYNDSLPSADDDNTCFGA